MAAVAAAAAAASAAVTPPSRDELMLVDQELRQLYRSAGLREDGSTSRDRKNKHDTATRRWIDTVGFPSLAMGKLPNAHDLAMVRSGPRKGLRGTMLKARDAWSQLHARDPRSKQLTAAEARGQRTLLDLLDTENEVFSAQSAYVAAKYRLILASFRVYNSMGALLPALGLAPPQLTDDEVKARIRVAVEGDNDPANY